MKITIQPYNKMRYATCGDYLLENGHWHFYIAHLSKKRYEWLVTFHEIIECYLCYWLGIKEKDISDFDTAYERERPEGDDSEPGDCRFAPYYYQHQIATFFERILATILLVSWSKYSQDIERLYF